MLSKTTLVPIALFGILLIVIFYIAYALRTKPPQSGLKTALFTAHNRSLQVEIADTSFARTQGLSGREKLEEGTGMFFVFDTPGNYGFWMKDMKFPIDIVWIKNDTIVGFAEKVPNEPGKNILGLKIYNPPEYINKALELNSGDVERYGLRVGDTIGLELQE